MAALTNQIAAADVVTALDIEMAQNFNSEYDRLADVLGIFSPEVVAAGTALYTYEVTGSLNSTTVAEGDEVPLSKYSVNKTPIGEITLKPYRKATTAQAIAKSGYENAVMRTDAKMAQHVRADVIDDFFTFLATGTSTATGTTLQAALAQADAKLDATMEANGDKSDRFVHFVNTYDIANYLAQANVSTQTVFGMTYLQSFLGVTDIFVTSKVPQGTVYVTPVDNIHVYGVDFGTLGTAGLDYTVYDGSLIGIHHEGDHSRISSVTNVLTGAKMIAEILNYIVVSSIAPISNDSTIHSFKIGSTAGTIDLEANTVAVALTSGTTITNIASTFTLADGATAKIGSKAQVSGTTKNDWTSGTAKNFKVTAADGTSTTWAITLTVA